MYGIVCDLRFRDSTIIDELVWIFDMWLMIKNMTSIDRWLFYWLSVVRKYWFYCYFEWFLDSDFDSLRSEYLCIECDFWLSSINNWFIRLWWHFGWVSSDFWWCWEWWNAWFWWYLSKSVSKWKWWKMCLENEWDVWMEHIPRILKIGMILKM